jgi:nitrite reductase/ring-hydroxylating ferredoxin subunit
MALFVSTLVIVLVLLAQIISSFRTTLPSRFGSSSSLKAGINVGTASEIPNGERKIVDTPSGTVIIANVDGSFYAVNAKCPHLGLPMKKGPITVENGEPTITCNFHNSKFELNTGKCTAW